MGGKARPLGCETAPNSTIAPPLVPLQKEPTPSAFALGVGLFLLFGKPSPHPFRGSHWVLPRGTKRSGARCALCAGSAPATLCLHGIEFCLRMLRGFTHTAFLRPNADSPTTETLGTRVIPYKFRLLRF